MDEQAKARIHREVSLLAENGQQAEFFESERPCVIFRNVPTSYDPATTDMVVPVPDGYPGAAIDLAGLPAGSPFIGRSPGSQNVQGQFTAGGTQWVLGSYHPHQWAGNAWDPTKHGFHTYFDHVLSWVNANQ